VDAERGVPFSVRGGTGSQLEDENHGKDPGVPLEAGAVQVQGLIHGIVGIFMVGSGLFPSGCLLITGL
jgi:hypothetical protein